MNRRRTVTKSTVVEVERNALKCLISDEEELPPVGPSDILIQVRACGLSGAEVERANSELLKGSCNDQSSQQLRLHIGQDVAGTVRAVGTDVTTLNVGDNVAGIIPLDYHQSGCAAFVVLQEFDVAILPESVSFVEAAACIGDAVKAYTALHYLGRLISGDTVLVLGGGTPVGSMCVQLARHWGAKVLTTVGPSHEEKQHLSNLKLDANDIVDIHSGLKSSLMLETGSLGADIIVDPQASCRPEDPSTHDIISCLAVGGRWVTSKAQLQLDPPNSRQLLLRCASVGFLFDQAWMLSSAQQGRYQHILMDVMEKVATKTIQPFIVRTLMSLDEVPEVMEDIDEFPSVGKVVLSLP